jgi:hypothetical protein
MEPARDHDYWLRLALLEGGGDRRGPEDRFVDDGLFSKLPLTLFSRVWNQSMSCDSGSGTQACTAPVGWVI